MENGGCVPVGTHASPADTWAVPPDQPQAFDASDWCGAAASVGLHDTECVKEVEGLYATTTMARVVLRVVGQPGLIFLKWVTAADAAGELAQNIAREIAWNEQLDAAGFAFMPELVGSSAKTLTIAQRFYPHVEQDPALVAHQLSQACDTLGHIPLKGTPSWSSYYIYRLDREKAVLYSGLLRPSEMDEVLSAYHEVLKLEEEVICHADAHPGNIVTSTRVGSHGEEPVTLLVDFDHVRVGPAGYDLTTWLAWTPETALPNTTRGGMALQACGSKQRALTIVGAHVARAAAWVGGPDPGHPIARMGAEVFPNAWSLYQHLKTR